LTGASGRLGTELRKLRSFAYTPTHKEMDVANFGSVLRYTDTRKGDIDLIVHCAAYTDTAKAEIFMDEAYAVNVYGPKYLGSLRIPMLYISTEYVFDGEKGMYAEEDFPNPKNHYALTKLIGEQQSGPFTKILRCIFKPNPWPFAKAYDDQWTSGDYVDIMAAEVNKAITLFDQLPRIIHVGTFRKTMMELARQTRPDVEPNSIHSAPIPIPCDCSLDLTRWNDLKKENKLP
jgi:dTDP-4-dehydrorhamnose reductase